MQDACSLSTDLSMLINVFILEVSLDIYLLTEGMFENNPFSFSLGGSLGSNTKETELFHKFTCNLLYFLLYYLIFSHL